MQIIERIYNIYDSDVLESTLMERINNWIKIMKTTNFKIMNKHVIDLNCLFN